MDLAPHQEAFPDPRDKSSYENISYRSTIPAPNVIPCWQHCSPFSPNDGCLSAKGALLSIATQGSYWLSSPHPLALTTASRPGIPATVEIRSRAGTRGRRAERGAEARGRRHTRTSPSNPAPVDARTRPHTRERPLIIEISHRPKAPAAVAPSPHLMPSRVSDAALLSHRTTAA